MNSCLKSAQKSLCIQSVNLTESKVFIRDDIDLETLDRDVTAVQTFRAVTRIKEISLTHPDTEEDIWDYRFIYTIGIRLIFSSEKAESSNDDYKPLLEITGLFEAKYLSENELTKDELEAFSKDNVGYHTWPYWREYVQSTCSRMGFSPAFEVPVYIVNRSDEKCELNKQQ